MKRQTLRKIVSILLIAMMLISDIPFGLLLTEMSPPSGLAEPVPFEQQTETPTPPPTDEPIETPTPLPTDEQAEEPTAESTETPTEESTAEPTDKPAEEPTAEPTEMPTKEPVNTVYAEEDFYKIAVTWAFEALEDQVMPELEPINVHVRLEYLDETDNWQPVASAEKPEEYSVFIDVPLDGSEYAKIPMIGLPVEREYRARIVGLEDMHPSYDDGDLSTKMRIETPHANMTMGPAGFIDIMPLAIVEETVTLEVHLTVDKTKLHTDKITHTLHGNNPETVTAYSSFDKDIVYTVVFSPDAEDVIHYTIHTASAEDKYSFHEYKSKGFIGDGEEIALRALSYIDHSFTKIWNDNNWSERPQTASFQLEVQDNAHPDVWTPVSGADYIYPLPNTNDRTQSHTFAHLPSFDGNMEPLNYRVREIEDITDKYVVTYDTDGGENTTITNTRKTSITIDKEWRDAGAPDARPSADTWKDGLTLKRTAPDGTVETVTISKSDITISDDDSPSWETVFKNLPMYDPSGNPYTYYVEESTSGWDHNEDFGDYATVTENVGEYREEAKAIYDGGTSTSTIEDTIQFVFNKVWKDGDGENRPDLKFELYRMMVNPDNPGAELSVSTASPVSGMDSMNIVSEGFDFSKPITYQVGDNADLPRYGPEGHMYIYFLVEKYVGAASDYVQELQDEDPYLLNDKAITNRKQKTVNPTVSKKMNARALQDVRKDVTFGLERRSQGGEFEPVEGASLTIEGFSAEKMEQTGAFSGYPGYDPDGYPYEYRAVEKSITIGDETGDIQPDGTLTVAGHTFKMTVDPDTGEIVNTLIGETAIGMKKTWEPEWTDTQSEPSITVMLYRDGEPYTLSPLPSVEGLQITADQNGRVTITRTDPDVSADFDVLFTGLPGYDEGGRPYEYTLGETACAAPYGFEDLSYSEVEDDPNYGTYHVANILNVSGDKERLAFDVKKIWLDDGDAGHRETVTVGLFYDANEGEGEPDYQPIADTEFTVSEEEMWMKRYFYIPKEDGEAVPYDVNDPRWQYENYVLRETKVGGGSVGYANAPAMAAGNGNVTAEFHYYKVSHSRENINAGQFTITNLRVGTLSVVINKEWAIGKTTDLDVEFTLYKAGAAVTPAQTLLWGEKSVTFANLDKYDNLGAIIPYSADETGLKKSTDTIFTGFAGSVADVPEIGKIVKSFSLVSHVVGMPYHSGDVMTYNAKNARSESGVLSINKVWRDEKEGFATRPDIVFEVTRKIPDGEDPDDPTPSVDKNFTTQRNWDTSPHHWYWTCDFGTLPRYNAKGYEYEYRVTEQLKQDIYYTQTYYNGEEQPVVNPDVAPKSSEDIFEPMGAAEYAIATFDKDTRGTVINTVQRNLDIPVFKLWEAVPAWFSAADLPDATIELYRMTALETTKVYDADHYVASITLENGAPGDTFTAMDMYTPYGVRYMYYIQEDELTGYGSSHHDANFTVTNTYMADNMPKVSITVTKDWDWTAMGTDQTEYPSVTFELWQSLDGAMCGDTYYKKEAMDGGAIAQWQEPASVTFSDLPYYAPDGETPFDYIVKETPALAGYVTTPNEEQNVALAGSGDSYSGAVAFMNTYTPEMQATITATKVWADLNNKFGLRPTLSQAQAMLNYELWRKLPGGAEDRKMAATPVWTDGGENTWICTFTLNEDAPTYSTGGETYLYYVKETLKSPYDVLYKPSHTEAHPLTYTNTLKTVKASFTKKWIDQNGDDIPQGRLTPMLDFGMPAEIEFALYSGTDNESFTLYDPAIKHIYPIEQLLGGATHTFSEELPEYGLNAEHTAAVLNYYMIREIDDTADFITVQNPDSVTNNHANITNKISVRKLYFVKNWEDVNNQDGKRPTSLDINVTQAGLPAVTATVTLSKNSTSGDPSQEEGHPDPEDGKGNRWRGELWLPDTQAGTVAEAAKYDAEELLTAADTQNGYEEQPARKEPVENPTWFSFTNSRDVQLIDISATKSWKGEVTDTIRPPSVKLQLQARGVGEGDDKWKAVEDVENPQEIFGNNTDETWADEALWTGLPAYMPKDDPTKPAVFRQYRVVEIDGSLGYTMSSVSTPPDIDDSTAEVAIALTNTMETIDITGTKTWDDQGDAYGRRPEPEDFVLTVGSAAGSFVPVAGTDAKQISWSESGSIWTYTIHKLPKYELVGSDVLLARYTVTETVPMPQYEYTTPATVEAVDEDGTVKAANFKNALKTAQIAGSKNWIDDENKFNIRPKEETGAWLTLKVYFGDGTTLIVPNTQYTVAWAKGSGDSEWVYTITGLPLYDTAGDPATYTVAEEVPAGYTGTITSNTVTAVESGTAQVAAFENEITLITIKGTKTWVGDNSEPELWIEELELTVFNQFGKMEGWEISWDKRGGDKWEYTISGLPRYIPGLTPNAPPVKAAYTVQEEDDHRYRHDPISRQTTGTVDQDSGNVTNADFTNTLAVGTLKGTKVWEDNNNAFGLRPENLGELEIKLFYGDTDDEVPANHYQITWEQDAGDPKQWNYTIKNLPCYDADDELVTYRIEEVCPYGYEMTSAPPAPIKMKDTGDQTIDPFVNSLATISIAGRKIWDDGSDANGVRPGTVQLVIYADGNEIKPSPILQWTDTDTDIWNFSADGLPMYWPGGTKPAVYTVEEKDSGVQYVVSYSDTYDTDPVTGNISGLDVTNTIMCELAIENLTVNQAKPGHTNAGGFVAVNTISVAEREHGDYVNKGLYVFWKAEEYWKPSHALSVTYLPRTGGGVKTIHFTMEDLGPLKEVFPEATLTEVQGGYELLLSRDFLTMPIRTDVQVKFLPTIAVLNTTGRKAGGAFVSAYMVASSAALSTAPATGGEVSVEGGHWDKREDGVADRYVEQTVYGKAANGYIVDFKNLSLSIPNGVRAPGQGVRLNPKADGSFVVSLSTPLGGETPTVTVRGKVEVLQRNAKGEPLSVSVYIDDMPCPMDVGINFIRSGEPGDTDDTPQTGDTSAIELYCALMLLGCAMTLFGIELLRKKRLYR